jgi:hypothetical protein
VPQAQQALRVIRELKVFRVKLDLQVHKVFKVILAQQVLKAFKVPLDQLALQERLVPQEPQERPGQQESRELTK